MSWWLSVVFIFIGAVFGSLLTAVYFLDGKKDGKRWWDE